MNSLIAGECGASGTRRIARRIFELINSDNLYMFSLIPSVGFHALNGDRKGQWAIKINANRRMIIISPDGPPPKDHGNIEYLKTVRKVKIEELCVDYH